MKSRHSRRRLPPNRSHTEFASGARTGVRRTRTPRSVTPWSRALEKMLSRSWITNRYRCPPGSVCAWRINRIKRLSEFGTSLDSASATGTNRDQVVMPFLPQAVPAGALPAPHAFDGRYSNVENRLASPPDRLWSRIRCGRDTRGESCRSVALRRGAKAARKEQS